MAKGRRRSQPIWARSRWATLFSLGIFALVTPALIAYSILILTFPSSGQMHTNTICQPLLRASSANPIMRENACPGSDDWRVDHPLGPQQAIEGFSVPASVNRGESLHLYVSTTAPSYRFRVYRIGWYGGHGARLLYSSAVRPGFEQPAPLFDPATRSMSAHNWVDPQTLPIPATWISGVYLVKLLSSEGFMRYVPFVVRNDQAASLILVQTSILTYQAYNLWGGYSLYRGLDATGQPAGAAFRSYAVSFDRPYLRFAGMGDFALYEYRLVRWLERQGYDVSYTTDVDTDLRGALLLHHRLLLIAGHDEYWSTGMRAHVTTARDAGISLAFFGANDLYWHVRLQASPLGLDRLVICYKDARLDPLVAREPQEATVLWRAPPLNQPESQLLGQQYEATIASPAPLILAPGAAPFLKGTGLQPGSALVGLVGGEIDRVSPAKPFARRGIPSPRVTVLARSLVTCVYHSGHCPRFGVDVAMATLYTAPSGARVFDAGTFFWAWGLDDDQIIPQAPAHHLSTPGFQLFSMHLIAYLLLPPAPTTRHPVD